MKSTKSTASSSTASVPSRRVRKSSASRLPCPLSNEPIMGRATAEGTSNSQTNLATRNSATLGRLTTEGATNSNRSNTKEAARRGPTPASASTETTTTPEQKISMHPASTGLAMGIRGTTATRASISNTTGEETITIEVDIRGKAIRGSNTTGSHFLNIRGKTTVLRPTRVGISSSRAISSISSQLLSRQPTRATT